MDAKQTSVLKRIHTLIALAKRVNVAQRRPIVVHIAALMSSHGITENDLITNDQRKDSINEPSRRSNPNTL